MPRIPRNLILEEGFQAHKMWRSHNNEWNLAADENKKAYLNELNIVLEKHNHSNKLNAYDLMSNHSHELFQIENKIDFSNIMRNHHSRYGIYFNKTYKRKGKVAYDRPKTCLIEDDEYSMNATFYIHANPIKAGITKNAANYRWSTHKLYAFGKSDKFMKYVVFPNWYMKLGKTWKARQKKYRKLFDEYLRISGIIQYNFLEKPFYGSRFWILEFSNKISNWINKNKFANAPP